MSRRQLITFSLGFATVSLTGCGGARVSGPVANPAKESLADLAQFLKQLSDEKKKPPGRIGELEALEPLIPTAGAAIRTGQITYFWGATYAAGGSKVVAHEKKTPDSGGLVLLEDGTIKEMTADEFKAAPKAKK